MGIGIGRLMVWLGEERGEPAPCVCKTIKGLNRGFLQEPACCPGHPSLSLKASCCLWISWVMLILLEEINQSQLLVDSKASV